MAMQRRDEWQSKQPSNKNGIIRGMKNTSRNAVEGDTGIPSKQTIQEKVVRVAKWGRGRVYAQGNRYLNNGRANIL